MKNISQMVSLSGRKKKKVQRQVEKYLEDIKRDKKNYKLHIELADSYALLEEFDHSIRYYYSAIELLHRAPNYPKLRSLILQLYGKIVEIAPDEQKAYLELSEEYIAAGQKEKAFRFLLSGAKNAYERENYDLALQCYNQVLAKGKVNPHIVERCTELYLKLGRKEEAMENYIYIGDMYAEEEKNIEALEYYEKASALDKDNPDIMLKIARMYKTMEWTENAASELVKLAEYYEKQQNYHEALKFYRSGANIDPDNEKAHQGRDRVTDYMTIDISQEDLSESADETSQEILQKLDKIEDSPEADSEQIEQPILPEIDLSAEESPSKPPLPLENNVPDLHEEELEAFVLGDDVHTQQPEPEEAYSEERPILDLEEDHEKSAVQETSEGPLQLSVEHPGNNGVGVKTEIQAIPVESLHELSEMSDLEEPPENSAQGRQMEELEFEASDVEKSRAESPEIEEPTAEETEVERSEVVEEEPFSRFPEETAEVQEQPDQSEPIDNIVELQQKVWALEQQLENTEEEKYFLQEQFTAQIGHLKAKEENFQKEITQIYKEKEALEKQLQQVTQGHRISTIQKDSEQFDEARYEALVAKIQNKKELLQQHLTRLLQKREENGRFLTNELNALGATKQRLQHNLEYIQQLKARIEEKIHTELHDAKQEIQSLKETSQALDLKLLEQQQAEQDLCKQIDTLHEMQENSTETIDALTAKNAALEHELAQTSEKKAAIENTLKKKLQSLYRSYRHLKTEHEAELQSKEIQINESAQKLSEIADKYVKLEQTFADIRKERDKLGTIVAQETATRETLEERLVGIESQVESLEVQGTELLNQLGVELDYHFNMEQDASDELQLSLEELEKLLLLQEQEIRSLETGAL